MVRTASWVRSKLSPLYSVTFGSDHAPGPPERLRGPSLSVVLATNRPPSPAVDGDGPTGSVVAGVGGFPAIHGSGADDSVEEVVSPLPPREGYGRQVNGAIPGRFRSHVVRVSCLAFEALRRARNATPDFSVCQHYRRFA